MAAVRLTRPAHKRGTGFRALAQTAGRQRDRASTLRERFFLLTLCELSSVRELVHPPVSVEQKD